MYAPSQDYKTGNATVSVTARSVDGTPASTGFGLIVHGERSKTNELEDYAFLIYNGAETKYEIVKHKGGNQTALVPWTKTTSIHSGASPNTLEVRAKGTELTFYINGEYVDRITDSENFKGGIAGLKGTKVQLWAKSNRPLSGGSLEVTGQDLLTLEPAAGEEATGTFEIRKPGKVQVRVIDTAGQPSADTFTAPITLLADERPFIRLLQPPALSLATPTAGLPVAASAPSTRSATSGSGGLDTHRMTSVPGSRASRSMASSAVTAPTSACRSRPPVP